MDVASRKQDRPRGMTDIYISSRRDDSGASRLSAALTQAFGPAHVFRGSDEIAADHEALDAIDSHLHSVDILLAVIGPAWLQADGSGRRRIDVPGDSVGAEIRAALAAGKPVWPVLVGGAALPAAEELPAAIRGLARRPAVVVSDGNWQDDVAQLVEALQPRQLPPTVRRTGFWELSAAAGVLVATLLIADAWIEREVARLAAGAAIAAEPLDGRWTAQVAYGQGSAHDEHFALRQEGGSVVGSASYLGQPHAVEAGSLSADGRMQFVTRSEAAAGSPQPTLTHRYRGKLEQDSIAFVLETTDGSAASPPLSFVAWENNP
ncbi:MAG TPA: hypothetical protein VF096_00050 [Azonexus sp.]